MTTATITRLNTPLARTRPDLIARWLRAVALMVLVMVVVGGVTRLTKSGLSMTEWNPILGFIPPLNDAQWQAELAKYQMSPQYRLTNRGMTLAAFKGIFFWEYLHRVVARVLVVVVYFLPLAWFALKRQIPKRLVGRLVIILGCFGLQGAIGWLMVASGLVAKMTSVDPVMLAAHFAAAMVLLSAVVWTALDCQSLATKATARMARFTPVAGVVILLLGLQLVYGALTAGLHAGYVANTWPLMNDHVFPLGVTWQGMRTLIADPYLVHFIHRWWAFGVFVAVMVLARRVRKLERAASIAIHIAVGIQIVLGIATVMSGVWIYLAVAHQLTGALLLVTTVWAAHVLGRPRVNPLPSFHA